MDQELTSLCGLPTLTPISGDEAEFRRGCLPVLGQSEPGMEDDLIFAAAQ